MKMKRKNKRDPSLVYCSKYDISFPLFTDILIDPKHMIHRLILTPCPIRECDGRDEYGKTCQLRVSPSVMAKML